jgi:hypothetical protein
MVQHDVHAGLIKLVSFIINNLNFFFLKNGSTFFLKLCQSFVVHDEHEGTEGSVKETEKNNNE